MKVVKRNFSICLVICIMLNLCATSIYAKSIESINATETRNNETEIMPYELNQWKRTARNFSFKVSTQKKTLKAMDSAATAAACTALGIKIGGTKGAVIGAALGNAISSYCSECIDEYYSRFGKKGYGTIVTGRYGSKLRMGVTFYSNAKRTKKVASYSYATDSYPI